MAAHMCTNLILLFKPLHFNDKLSLSVIRVSGYVTYVPYSMKCWWHKSLLNQQNITLAKKTLAKANLRGCRSIDPLM